MASRGILEQPHVRVHLVRSLAIGDVSTRDLAARYDCTQQAIRDFGRRHQARILEVRKDLDNQFAGLAYVEKRERLEAYATQAIDVRALLDDPNAMLKAGVARAEMERVYQAALRSIADELGDIPAKSVVQVGSGLEVTVSGIDIKDLM